MIEDDSIPTCGEHRGVPLHCYQEEERLDVVRGDIDTVHAMTDWRELWRIVRERRLAPEALLYAAAKLRAIHGTAANSRVARPDFDLELLGARVAGMNSMTWIDSVFYGSCLLNVRRVGDDSLTRRSPEGRAAVEAEEARRRAISKAQYEAERDLRQRRAK